MNKKSLILELRKIGVHSYHYALGGNEYTSDIIILRRKFFKYYLYYFERGEFTLLETFKSKEDAYIYIYNRFLESSDEYKEYLYKYKCVELFAKGIEYYYKVQECLDKEYVILTVYNKKYEIIREHKFYDFESALVYAEKRYLINSMMDWRSKQCWFA